jgi:hypothetical protein
MNGMKWVGCYNTGKRLPDITTLLAIWKEKQWQKNSKVYSGETTIIKKKVFALLIEPCPKKASTKAPPPRRAKIPPSLLSPSQHGTSTHSPTS